MSAPIVRAEYTPGGKQAFPVSTTLAAPPVQSVFGVTQGQVSAVYTTSITLTYPVATVGSFVTQTAKVTLSGWPKSLTLTGTQKAQVALSFSVAAAQPNLFFGLPYATLLFGSGSPLQAAGTGTSVYTLQTGRTYASPTVSVTIPAQVMAAYPNPLAVPFTLSALLFGALS